MSSSEFTAPIPAETEAAPAPAEANPGQAFAELGLSGPLLAALADVGYETPSPIQAACIPVLLEGHDLLGMAQTGTGKTAAFALPILERIDPARHVPQALVLAPTRELAIQVSEAFQSYAKHLPGFHVLPIYGGQSYGIQLRQLERGPQVIVGTPGRVMDHLERQTLKLDGLRSLVLDEADEMLRMGFIDDVEWILEHTPAERQTALFSATMPDAIRRVAQRYLRNPREVKIKSATQTVAAIRQRYWQVSGLHKLDALTRILEVEEDFDAAIIFVRTKTATVELAEKLEARGYAAAALNGDLNQVLRERVIDQLKSGSLDIVIATDVAARGIDVPRISHVINYDIPYDTEAYVHRIGRTGRAGRQGTAILFVAPREMRMLRTIERVTRQPIEPLPLPSKKAVADRRIAVFKAQVTEAMAALDEDDKEFFTGVVGEMVAESEMDAHDIAAALVYLLQKERPFKLEGPDDPRDGAGARAARDGSYTILPEPARKSWREDRPARGESDEGGYRDAPRRERTTPRAEPLRGLRPGATERYRLEVGRDHGATPKDIVGAIANEAGIESRFIGRIDLFDDHSTVELPAELPREVLQVLRRVRVRQQMLQLSPADEGGAGRGEGGFAPGRPSVRPEGKPFGKSYGKPPYGGNREDDGRGGRPGGERKPFDPSRSYGDRPAKPYSSGYGGDRSGERSYERPNRSEGAGSGEKFQGQHFGAKSGGDKPWGAKPFAKSYGDKPHGDKPYGDKPYGDKPYGEKPYAGKSYGDKPYGGKPGAKSFGGAGKPAGDERPRRAGGQGGSGGAWGGESAKAGAWKPSKKKY